MTGVSIEGELSAAADAAAGDRAAIEIHCGGQGDGVGHGGTGPEGIGGRDGDHLAGCGAEEDNAIGDGGGVVAQAEGAQTGVDVGDVVAAAGDDTAFSSGVLAPGGVEHHQVAIDEGEGLSRHPDDDVTLLKGWRNRDAEGRQALAADAGGTDAVAAGGRGGDAGVSAGADEVVAGPEGRVGKAGNAGAQVGNAGAGHIAGDAELVAAGGGVEAEGGGGADVAVDATGRIHGGVGLHHGGGAAGVGTTIHPGRELEGDVCLGAEAAAVGAEAEGTGDGLSPLGDAGGEGPSLLAGGGGAAEIGAGGEVGAQGTGHLGAIGEGAGLEGGGGGDRLGAGIGTGINAEVTTTGDGAAAGTDHPVLGDGGGIDQQQVEGGRRDEADAGGLEVGGVDIQQIAAEGGAARIVGVAENVVAESAGLGEQGELAEGEVELNFIVAVATVVGDIERCALVDRGSGDEVISTAHVDIADIA